MEQITFELLRDYLTSVGAVMCGIAIFYVVLNIVLISVDTIKRYVSKWKK